MGCDIHLFVETRNLKGQWQAQELKENPLEHRSYLYFSLFAGVRNHFPIYIKPLGFHKGFPVDVSDFLVKSYYSYYSEEEDTYKFEINDTNPNNDNHSAHWISLKELSQFDWNTPLLNYIDHSGYNQDYDSYPPLIQKYFTRREPMSQKNALDSIIPYCSEVDMTKPESLTLENFLGSTFVKYIHNLYEQYPEGRLIYYFDN